jgi:hypothetical protein
MSDISFKSLPETLKSVKTRPLFAMRLDADAPFLVGETPSGERRVIAVPGGEFEGERLSGKVLGGGADWQGVRSDGATTLDVRIVLETTDGALITMRYRGLRHGPPEVIARIANGETVDPSTYYFRITPVFETASDRYDWINRILAVGIGTRRADGPIYSIFELL